MTLAEHLARGYDAYVHGTTGVWSRQQFKDELLADDALRLEAVAKLAQVQAVVDGDRRCDVSRVQRRILADGLDAA